MSSLVSVHWFSRKGQARERNSDACAVFSNASTILAIIGDASEKGLQGSEYVMTWMASVVDQMAIENAPTCDLILTVMRNVHRQLRPNFPSARACWGALFIDHKNEKVWMFSCGDCRAGIENEDGTIKWHTTVHSQANWQGEEFLPAHAKMPYRHQVTRSLNAKRFVDPDVMEIDYDQQGRWVLATDGYWVEHQMECASIHDLQDDASFFRVSCIKNSRCVESDSDNYYQV
ncbi:hypothetical protein [Undibacterium sp.]|uniref:PP2C family protein-serine/threonine phosphatase n=1 Tax=Undibacterium sp. TaxID=1914977 RepID=UPI0025CFBE48|nr:hypothetical protein [Undibacterium sp.]